MKRVHAGSRRTLTLRRQEEHVALEAAQRRERESDFVDAYARRVGVQGMISQSVRAMHLRRSRDIG